MLRNQYITMKNTAINEEMYQKVLFSVFAVLPLIFAVLFTYHVIWR